MHHKASFEQPGQDKNANTSTVLSNHNCFCYIKNLLLYLIQNGEEGWFIVELQTLHQFLSCFQEHVISQLLPLHPLLPLHLLLLSTAVR